MVNLLHIWDTIVKSNTFNFFVMLLLLGWIVKKVNLANTLNKFKSDVIKSIENSKQEKENGISALKDAEKSVENIEAEIAERLEIAKKQAENIEKDILNLADNKIKQIENSISKVIENEEKQISTKLIYNTTQDAVKLAKEKISKLLEENPILHEKFINESLEELDRIEL